MRADTALDALAVFSHPDDAELTMAGTLLKLKSLGYVTGVADMTGSLMPSRYPPWHTQSIHDLSCHHSSLTFRNSPRKKCTHIAHTLHSSIARNQVSRRRALLRRDSCARLRIACDITDPLLEWKR